MRPLRTWPDMLPSTDWSTCQDDDGVSPRRVLSRRQCEMRYEASRQTHFLCYPMKHNSSVCVKRNATVLSQMPAARSVDNAARTRHDGRGARSLFVYAPPARCHTGITASISLRTVSRGSLVVDVGKPL